MIAWGEWIHAFREESRMKAVFPWYEMVLVIAACGFGGSCTGDSEPTGEFEDNPAKSPMPDHNPTSIKQIGALMPDYSIPILELTDLQPKWEAYSEIDFFSKALPDGGLMVNYSDGQWYAFQSYQFLLESTNGNWRLVAASSNFTTDLASDNGWLLPTRGGAALAPPKNGQENKLRIVIDWDFACPYFQWTGTDSFVGNVDLAAEVMTEDEVAKEIVSAKEQVAFFQSCADFHLKKREEAEELPR